MKWFLLCFKNYIGFSGRSRRKEYWYFVLFNAIISIIFSLSIYIPMYSSSMVHDDSLGNYLAVSIIGALYSLVIFLPSLAVFFRRMHDTGRSGLWFLLNFVPLIGPIILVVFAVQDSEPGDNKYGPNPKNEIASEA